MGDNVKLMLDKIKQRADRKQQKVSFWWRDDDARDWIDSLAGYVDMAQKRAIPCALAVIMGKCSRDLADMLRDKDQVSVLIHGWNHVRNTPGRTGEFTGMDFALVKQRAGLSMAVAKTLFAGQLVPVIVPPWNALDPSLYGIFQNAGYVGVSQARGHDTGKSSADDNFKRCDIHVDVLQWSPEARLKSLEEVSKIIENTLSFDDVEAVGLMTHHRVGRFQDSVDLMNALFDQLQPMAEVEFVSARSLFRTQALKQ